MRRVRNRRKPSLVLIGCSSVSRPRFLIAASSRRDDQFGFSWIENIRRRKARGILAPPVEDGLGAAVGQQVLSVADTLDDQRYRNVVDHQFKKFLGAFEFLGKRSAVGDVIEQRDQEFRLVLVVAARSRGGLAITRFFEPRSTRISLRKWPSDDSSAAPVCRFDAGRRFAAWKISSARFADDVLPGKA